jgi:RNA polymerase sigma-70 factor, ECF subfamily
VPDEARAARASRECFTRLAERYRGEIESRCLRMLGSREDAEDAVQETFVRAWRARRGYRGDSSFRTWLFRIAINVCLDTIERRGRTPSVLADADPEELERRAALTLSDPGPDGEIADRDSLETGLWTAVQRLPAKQRTALVLQGMLGYSARDTGTMLDSSTASVNSALQRARRTLSEHLPRHPLEWRVDAEPSGRERELLARYREAIERADAGAFLELDRELGAAAAP